MATTLQIDPDTARSSCNIRPKGFDAPRNTEACSGLAFTLIELMLVIMVIGIVIATAAPYMAKSIRGNRLRFAALSVVSAGKYARSMAVMSQKDVVLRFDLDSSTLSVDGVTVRREPEPAPVAEEPAPTPDQFAQSVPEQAETNAAPVESSPMPRLSRKLDEVKIASVEIQGGDTASGGTCSINYSRAGTCPPYTVKLSDTRGDSMTIEVDALAGAKVERGL